jgi:hypothetical protein
MRALMISCFSVICFNFMQLFFTCIVWSLWLHQNDVILNDATPDLQGCFYLILHRLSLWLKIDRNTFAYTRMDLGISSDGIKFWDNRITHSWLLPFFPLFGLCSLSFVAAAVLLWLLLFFFLLLSFSDFFGYLPKN